MKRRFLLIIALFFLANISTFAWDLSINLGLNDNLECDLLNYDMKMKEPYKEKETIIDSLTRTIFSVDYPTIGNLNIEIEHHISERIAFSGHAISKLFLHQVEEILSVNDNFWSRTVIDSYEEYHYMLGIQLQINCKITDAIAAGMRFRIRYFPDIGLIDLGDYPETGYYFLFFNFTFNKFNIYLGFRQLHYLPTRIDLRYRILEQLSAQLSIAPQFPIFTDTYIPTSEFSVEYAFSKYIVSIFFQTGDKNYYFGDGFRSFGMRMSIDL